MPIYEYECKTCGSKFEFLKIRSDEECTECKVCESTEIQKIISVSNFRMNSDDILKSLPDPTPPLEELRDCRPGALADKPHMSSELKDYVRRKDVPVPGMPGATADEWIPKDESDKKTMYFT